MKKFLVFVAIFAAMFLIMSCGGSDNKDDNKGGNGGNTEENGGNTGDNGGSTGDNGGNTGDNGGNTADSGDTENNGDPDDSGEGEDEDGESTFATEPEAYLPASYADKTLDAWYMLKEADEDKIKIEAVFLFNDNTLVVTSSKVYSVEDGREPEKKINAEGTFTITSGDYDNGEAHVVAGEMEFDVTISDGILSAMDAEFAKQDNADAPEAQ